MALVNVNLPEGRPAGIQWTRLSVRHYQGSVAASNDPLGREQFWLVEQPIEETEAGTDRWAFDHGFIALTPLGLDLTHERQLEAARIALPLNEAAGVSR
jgi:5'-nucleotidase